MLTQAMQREVLEKVERLNAELQTLPEGLFFVLVMSTTDWPTQPSPMAAFTVSNMPPGDRADLLDHLAKEIREGRNVNLGGPPT